MQFFKDSRINFVGKRHIFFFVSATMVIVGFLASILMGPELGIDFTGGVEIAVDFHKPIKIEKIRKVFLDKGLSGSEIKSFGQDNQFLIRVKEAPNVRPVLEKILKTEFKTYSPTILKIDQIGPKIGKEIALEALGAIILSIIAILLYLAFRFEFTFGLGAVIALLHDVFITFSFIVIFHHLNILDLQINQSIVAALLTVLGYSVNDTVIIFDRIRENKERYKGVDFIKMVNQSVNETLTRTVNTVGTLLLALIPLLIWGGPVLKGFSFTLLIGVISGTYSSIYIASSFVIWYLQKVKKVDMREFDGEEVPAKA